MKHLFSLWIVIQDPSHTPPSNNENRRLSYNERAHQYSSSKQFPVLLRASDQISSDRSTHWLWHNADAAATGVTDLSRMTARRAATAAPRGELRRDWWRRLRRPSGDYNINACAYREWRRRQVRLSWRRTSGRRRRRARRGTFSRRRDASVSWPPWRRRSKNEMTQGLETSGRRRRYHTPYAIEGFK